MCNSFQVRQNRAGLIDTEQYFKLLLFHLVLKRYRAARSSLFALFIDAFLWRSVSGAALSIVIISASIVILVVVRSILVGVCR
jgi:hypothetical protein